ncbi:fasciclin domain-containing protein [Nibrella saemangeumensis]|uniref:Fasciclin domain-containing protein n=1 Tax=Nibrella saemangeumensis TaxID=1084526 RepID=A0ABP8MB91_9BACT
MLLSGKLSRSFALLPLLMLLLSGCQQNEDAQPKTIADVILENNEFTILRAAILHGGMSDALKGANLTMFAPDDAAFRASGYADPAAITALPADDVRRLVQYHVLGNLVTLADIPGGTNTPVATAGGTTAFITNSNNQLFLNGSRIGQTAISAANGIIHVIDRVLNPAAGNAMATAQARGLNLLVAAAMRAASVNPGILTALNGGGTGGTNAPMITLFAPTDEAFRAAGYNEAGINGANPQTLVNLLMYHAVPGVLFSHQFQSGQLATMLSNNRITVAASTTGVSVRGTKNTGLIPVRTADIATNNGVMHIIDQVLLP